LHPVAAVIRGLRCLLAGAVCNVACSLGCPAQSLPAVPLPEAGRAALLHRVDQHYNHLRSLKSHYVERYNGMGLSKEESGTLLLKKPGRMLWRYDQPQGKVFVLDGKYAWFYTPGDHQAQRLAANKLDDLRTPLRFLLGHTQLSKELQQIVVAPEGTDYLISGVPKGLAQRVRELSLLVTPDGSIDRMKIVELDGATTEFEFTNSQENVPTQPADFIFTPPPGVVVVDALPPV
jgi:outer membrane lipoprotein carrier protein